MVPFSRLLGLLVIGMSTLARFWVLSGLIVLAWVGVAKADPPQPSKDSSPEEIESTTPPSKQIGPTRSVTGPAPGRHPTSRAGRATFVLTPEQKKEVGEIARMIVRQAPERAIRERTSAYVAAITKMDSQTEGAEALADEVSLEAMKRQVAKEMAESEREKSEKMIEAQREHVEKMLKMIEEMMKLEQDQFDTTLSR